jgi:Ni/Co efflux regulator RcnB
MTRMPIYILAALIAAAPLSAAAQDRGDRGGRDRDQDRERPQREQSDERPRISVGAAVQRASAGRPGRFLGASNRGDMIVVRWEYPGGRVADIMVDGRTGRVIGER